MLADEVERRLARGVAADGEDVELTGDGGVAADVEDVGVVCATGDRGMASDG